MPGGESKEGRDGRGMGDRGRQGGKNNTTKTRSGTTTERESKAKVQGTKTWTEKQKTGVRVSGEVFLAELAKAIRKDLLESHKINRELLEVLRDLRDQKAESVRIIGELARELALSRGDRRRDERRRTAREVEDRRKPMRRRA